MSSHQEAVISEAGLAHLRWSLIPEVGPILFGRLLERFGSAGAALEASCVAIGGIPGIGQERAARIVQARRCTDVEAEVRRAAARGVRILCRQDEGFPPGLRHIPDPPICLYVRGTLEPQDAVAIGIVGARRCTMYGREQARRFGHQLAARGLTVVSGLARGIDGEAHKGALEAGGRTIAVLGNGLSEIYPPEHERLAGEIAACGALISELPMETSPCASNFLPRNRLIAGLSLGVLVIEAAARSGSLTTARLAAEYDREVFALPGRVDSDFSRGTNGLIRDQHAKCVTCADDVVDELGEVGEALRGGPTKGQASAAPVSAALRNSLSADELCIYETLDVRGRPLERIAELADRPVHRVSAALISLQLKGLARQAPGCVFVRAREL